MKKGKGQNDSILVQGGILAAASIIVRIIGMLYRIPMNNIIGTNGMGYYSNAFSIYSIMLLLSSYSMPLAVSKMVSAQLSRKKYTNSYRIFRGSLVFGLGIGLIFGLFTWFGADFFASFLHMPLAVYAIRALAPTIFIMAILGVYRGYFQGMNTMVPTAFSQVLEQLVNAITSIAFALWLFHIGSRKDLVLGEDTYASALGAAGGTIGTGLGALAALLFLIVLFAAYKTILKARIREEGPTEAPSYFHLYRGIMASIIPVIICTALYNVVSLVDSAMLGQFMSQNGMQDEYETIWGIYTGEYITLINLPISLASALASSIIPAVMKAMAAGRPGMALQRISTAIRFTFLISVPSAVGLAVLANPLIDIMFPVDSEKKAASMLLIGSCAVIFFSLSTVTNAILQGINRLRIPIINTAISLVVHIVLVYILVYQMDMGIYGILFSYIVFALLITGLNNYYLETHTRLKLDFVKVYVLPVIASILMGAIVWGSYYLLQNIIGKGIYKGLSFIFKSLPHAVLTVGQGIHLLLAIFIGAVCYGLLIMAFRVLDESDVYDLPAGTRLVKLFKKMRLL